MKTDNRISLIKLWSNLDGKPQIGSVMVALRYMAFTGLLGIAAMAIMSFQGVGSFTEILWQGFRAFIWGFILAGLSLVSLLSIRRNFAVGKLFALASVGYIAAGSMVGIYQNGASLLDTGGLISGLIATGWLAVLFYCLKGIRYIWRLQSDVVKSAEDENAPSQPTAK